MTRVGEQLTELVYSLLSKFPRHDAQTPRQQLPENGIYFFFERGELVSLPSATMDRIVRVGTHTGDGNFRGRIRQHYGHVRSLSGNKNTSIFRTHVGGALLHRANPHDPRLPSWQKHMAPTFPEVEELVSRTLRQDFTFSCLRVNQAADRLHLERGLIALFAQHPLSAPSPEWLGHHAIHPSIRQSGLWNTQKVDAQPLTEDELVRLQHLIHVEGANHG